MKQIVLFFLFFTLSLTADQGAVIVLYGTQCCGKSTLVNQLQEILPSNATVIKRTSIFLQYRMDFVEKKTGKRPKDRRELIAMEARLPKEDRIQGGGALKSASLPPTLETIQKLRENGELVIFDVCLHKMHEIQLVKELNPLLVHVYAPLNELSKREQERTKQTKRNDQEQMGFRKYILNAFSKLYRVEEGSKAIGSLTREEVMQYWHTGNHEFVDQDSLRVLQHTMTHFQLDRLEKIKLTPIINPDLIIDTSVMTVEESAKLILRALYRS